MKLDRLKKYICITFKEIIIKIMAEFSTEIIESREERNK